ncbi:MAG: superoxide dismutase [Calditrichaeota bacterium]|nr:MAG: superoxide dismutase [Calditrichota bacterium]
MSFNLPDLPYDFSALEPHIDARTMEIHHGKHHAGYVNNLNNAISGQAGLESKGLDELLGSLSSVPEAVRTAVRNNGGGHWNHSFFWNIMSGNGGGQPEGDLAAAINDAFGSFDAFKEAFKKAGATRFGSGWAWLVVDASGALKIGSTANQDNPVMDISEFKGTPILGVDVWEHAYYLKYQNRRPDYLSAFFNVINWEAVGEHFKNAQ